MGGGQGHQAVSVSCCAVVNVRSSIRLGGGGGGSDGEGCSRDWSSSCRRRRCRRLFTVELEDGGGGLLSVGAGL